MPGYVYRGTVFDAPKPAVPEPVQASSELCGTPKGIWRHRANKESLCDPCRANNNEQRRAAHHRTKGQSRAKRLDTIEKLQQAEKLFAAGASQNKVHQLTGMSRATIRQYFPGQGWTHAQAAEYTNAKQRKKRTA